MSYSVRISFQLRGTCLKSESVVPFLTQRFDLKMENPSAFANFVSMSQVAEFEWLFDRSQREYAEERIRARRLLLYREHLEVTPHTVHFRSDSEPDASDFKDLPIAPAALISPPNSIEVSTPADRTSFAALKKSIMTNRFALKRADTASVLSAGSGSGSAHPSSSSKYKLDLDFSLFRKKA